MRRWLVCLLVVMVVGVPALAAESITCVGTVYQRQTPTATELGKCLTVHFLDVGGGDAILLDTPSDKKILIDGGWTRDESKLAEPEYRAYMRKFLGADAVDLIVITHPDYDHIAGLQQVVTTHEVKEAWYGGYDSPEVAKLVGWTNLVKELKSRLGSRYLCPVRKTHPAGEAVVFENGGTMGPSDDIILTIINAPSEIGPQAYRSGRHLNESQRRNSSSLVLRLDYGKTSFLFAGDTNGRPKDRDDVTLCDDQELLMCEQDEAATGPLKGKLQCTVLKVPHHGSNGSSSLRFLKDIHPSWAVISAGVPFGHPDAPTLTRLRDPKVGLKPSHLLRTDEGEDGDKKATEANLGDDCYQFVVDEAGIVRIEKWNVDLSSPN